MTGRIISLLAMAVILAVAGYAALNLFAPAPEALDLSRDKASEAGLYRVAIEPEAEPVPQNDIHSWLVSVRTDDGAPVPDAAISVDGGMPAHEHGLPTEPRSAGHIGDGRYRIEGVRFHMAGHWVLRLTIDSPAGTDDVTFNLML